MNTRRIVFWSGFAIIMGLIVWGLIVAMNKPSTGGSSSLGTPPAITSIDHVIGPENAPITIIEYSDFQCPACEYYYYIVKRLVASSTVPIRFAYRDFPLSDVLPDGSVQHPNALPASQATEAAGLQGKFWEMYGLIFENQSEWSSLADPLPIFRNYAGRIGLDVDRFTKDMEDQTIKSAILEEKASGVRLGIDSTPTFFVNGKAISNPKNYEEFTSVIQATASDSSR